MPLDDVSGAELLDGDGKYNPLDDRHLARGVADALTAQDVHPLPPKGFDGAGIYALYYVGEFPLYGALSELCRHEGVSELQGLGPYAHPIYVGKAQAGAGRHGQTKTTRVLYNRINKHKRTIMAATTTLKAEDFRVRYLPVKDVWVPLGEQGLLQRFQPLWNVVLAGFGNNAPGGGRDKQARSPWDTIHPGRPWATNLPPNSESEESITGRVEVAVKAIAEQRPVPEDVLDNGIDDEEIDDAGA